MSALFQRHNFIWPGLTMPLVVEARVDDDQITLRTWKLSEDASLISTVPGEEAIAQYGSHAPPFEIDSNFNPSRQIREKHWIPLHALGGKFTGGRRSHNLYLQPISQVGFRIDINVLGSAAWSDYASWAFNATPEGKLKLPFNRYLETHASREHRHMMMISRKEINLMMLHVPFARQNFSNCVFVLKFNPSFGCIHNFISWRTMPSDKTNLGSNDLEPLYGFKALFASLRLSGPDVIPAGQTAAYAVEMFSKNTDTLVEDVETKVYLEAHAGYLPHRQVEIRNGVGGFPLMALGLSPGDKIKLKVGWRNFSGADEKIITVI